MRDQARSPKSSWPKLVVRKWLNIKSSCSDEFQSDYKTKEFFQKRRKSCSNDGHSTVVPEELSEEWLMQTRAQIGRSPFGHLTVPVSSSSSLDLRMFVGTWNVGGKSPHYNLNVNHWINTKEPADIYVLGFQEIVPLNAGNVFGLDDGSPANKWLSLIRRALNGESGQSAQRGKYCLAVSKQMVGIFLCVWVREGLNPYITSLKASCVGTGIMGCLGNKGSVSISLTLHETSFCFVCTHLASGEKEGDEMRRNLDTEEILKRTRFLNSCSIMGKRVSSDNILDHDKIIWLGDLNYRLASICDDTFDLLEKNDWQALLEKDQLRIEQKAGRVFKDWEEGEIHFAPTYKYLVGSDFYAAQASSSSTRKEKRRTPAWCDRILWKGKGLKQMSYGRGESKFSDHRPVCSLFSVQIPLASPDLSSLCHALI